MQDAKIENTKCGMQVVGCRIWVWNAGGGMWDAGGGMEQVGCTIWDAGCTDTGHWMWDAGYEAETLEVGYGMQEVGWGMQDAYPWVCIGKPAALPSGQHARTVSLLSSSGIRSHQPRPFPVPALRAVQISLLSSSPMPKHSLIPHPGPTAPNPSLPSSPDIISLMPNCPAGKIQRLLGSFSPPFPPFPWMRAGKRRGETHVKHPPSQHQVIYSCKRLPGSASCNLHKQK